MTFRRKIGVVESAHYRIPQVRLGGPLRDDTSWQAAADEGFAAACFAVDWEAPRVTCPAGQQSSEWKPSVSGRGKEVIHVEFARAACQGCELRARCTKAAKEGRSLTLRPQEHHLAVAARRAAHGRIQSRLRRPSGNRGHAHAGDPGV